MDPERPHEDPERPHEDSRRPIAAVEGRPRTSQPALQYRYTLHVTVPAGPGLSFG